VTVREQIMAAVGPRLNTGRPVGIPEAVRARTHAIDVQTAGSLPAISFYMGPEAIRKAAGRDSSPLLDRTLSLFVEAYAAATAGTTADAALDPLCSWVETQLGEHEFGGLATGLQLVEAIPSLAPTGEIGNQTPIARMRMRFEVRFTSSVTNPDVTA
jgi:hypothetical protein